MGRVGVVGSINTDLVTMIDRVPSAGETRAASGFFVARGGKGANQAVAASRAGARTFFVGAVGHDAFGEQAVAALQADGIDTGHIIRADTPTGSATIIVEESGQNRILIAPGANAWLRPEDIDHAMTTLATCDVILPQLEIPLATVRHVIARAAEAGVPVVLNPAPATADLPLTELGPVAFLAPNETELALLSGLPTDSEEGATEAARALAARGIANVIVTRGASGALLVRPTSVDVIEAPRVEAVDTTGAGDAFLGSFAARWAERRDSLAALAFASRCASISVTRPGAQQSFPGAAEL